MQCRRFGRAPAHRHLCRTDLLFTHDERALLRAHGLGGHYGSISNADNRCCGVANWRCASRSATSVLSRRRSGSSSSEPGRFVSSTGKLADGSPAWGANPTGLLIFADNGRYSSIIVRSDLPKFASKNRMQGTPDENKAAVHGSIGDLRHVHGRRGEEELHGQVRGKHVRQSNGDRADAAGCDKRG